MTEFFKALRPDGTDFATGKTKPIKGRWLPRIEGDLVMCRHGYHVSDAVAETLVGGSWPCKLARVEIPEGNWERWGHKLVLPSYRVIEWLPAHLALGPNGEAVAALIERAKAITPEQAKKLAAAWSAAWSASSTWSAARAAARDAAWPAAWSASSTWSAARDAAWSAAWDAARDAARDAAWPAAWDAAGSATWSAARALMVRDLISPEQFDLLYGPWASVFPEGEKE